MSKTGSLDRRMSERLRSCAWRAKVPLIVKLDLTYACNLRCIHCYVVREDRRELDLGEVRDLLGQIAAKGCLYLTLSGGEVFVRKDVLEILEEAHRLGFATRLLTNGTLLVEDVIAILPKLRVGEVAVSLYGDVASVHEGVTRVPGSFESTVESIRRLRDVGILVRLNFVVLKQNRSRFREMYALAERLGADCVLDPLVSPRLDGSRSPLAYRVPTSSLPELVEYEEARTPRLNRLKDEWDRDLWLASGVCSAGSVTCSISPYGDVTPCTIMPIVAGNVRTQSFADIWDHSDVLKRMRGLRCRDLKVCSTCGLARFCTMCPALALAEDGDLLGPSRFRCAQASVRRAVFESTYVES